MCDEHVKIHVACIFKCPSHISITCCHCYRVIDFMSQGKHGHGCMAKQRKLTSKTKKWDLHLPFPQRRCHCHILWGHVNSVPCADGNLPVTRGDQASVMKQLVNRRSETIFLNEGESGKIKR